MSVPLARYEIRYRIKGSEQAYTTLDFPADSSTITLSGLNAGYEYDIEARSIGINGTVSAWVSVTQLIQSNPLAINLGDVSEAVADAQADASQALSDAADALAHSAQEALDRAAAITATANAAAADATAKANAALAQAQVAIDAVNAKADTAMAKLADIVNAPEHSAANAYTEDALVKRGTGLYRAKIAVPTGIAITNTTYWEYVGEYDSIGEALAASISQGKTNASAIASEASRIDGMLVRFPAGNGKVASAGVVDTITATVQAISNNKVRNATFAGTVGWHEAWNQGGGTFTFIASDGSNLDAGDTNKYLPKGVTGLRIRKPDQVMADGVHYQIAQTDIVPVEQLEQLIASTYVNSFRCKTYVMVAYYKANGDAVGFPSSVYTTPASVTNPTSLAQLPRPQVIATHGVEAVNARLILGVAGTGETNPYAFFALPMLETQKEGQTLAGRWVAGGLESKPSVESIVTRTSAMEAVVNSTTDGNAALKARILAEETVRANQHDAQATQISGLQTNYSNQQTQINSKASQTQLNDAIAGEAGARATALSNIQADYNTKLADKASNASVTAVATAAANALGVQAGRIDSVVGRMPAGNGQVADASIVNQAIVDIRRGAVNLIANPTFADGLNGYTKGAGNDAVVVTGYWGYALRIPPTSGIGYYFFDVPLNGFGGGVWTFQAKVARDSNVGQAYYDFEFLNGAKGSLGWLGQQLYFSQGNGFVDGSKTFTGISGAEYIRIYIAVRDTTQFSYFQLQKLAYADHETGFSDEQTIAANVSQTNALNLAVGGVNGSAVTSTSLTYRANTLEATKVEFLKVGNKVTGYRIGNNGLATNFELVADSIDLLTGSNTGVSITRNKMDRVFGNAAFYEGDPFGSDSLILWIGPSSIAKTSATKSNATLWFDYTGKSGYGGAVIQSANIKRATTTTTSPNTGLTVETGNFTRLSSNREITVNVGYFASRISSGSGTNSTASQSMSGVIEVSVDGGAWTQIGGWSGNGAYSVSYDSGIKAETSEMSGSGYITHSGSGTNLNFRARQTGGAVNLISGITNSATISIKVEQI